MTSFNGNAFNTRKPGNLARGLATVFSAWMISLTAPVYAAEEALSFISLDVAPWASTNATTGEDEGAFVEIVREVEKRLQKKVSITITPLARVERELQAGTQDCTILVPLPDELVVKGDTVAYHGLGMLSRKGVKIRDYDDLKSLKLSVIRGGILGHKFDTDESLHKEYDTDYLMGLRKVARGRLDAMVGAIPTLQYLAQQEGLQDMFEEPFLLINTPLVFQCSRNSKRLDQMEKINAILETIKTDGTLEKIQQRHHF